MKLYNGSKKIGILLASLLVLSIFSTEVFAGKIKRSCKAKYYAMVRSFSYENEKGDRKLINISYGEMRVYVGKGDFIAHGSCGKLVPNKCRKRARDKLIDCAWAHAKFPNMTRKPKGYNVFYYPTGWDEDLISLVKKSVCKRPLNYYGINHKKGGIDVTALFPSTYTAKFTLGIKTYGDDGCGSKNPRTFTTLDGERYSRTPMNSAGLLFTPLKEFTVTCP